MKAKNHLNLVLVLSFTISLLICIVGFTQDKRVCHQYPCETITPNPFKVGFKHKLCYSNTFCTTWNSLPSPEYNELEKEYTHRAKDKEETIRNRSRNPEGS